MVPISKRSLRTLVGLGVCVIAPAFLASFPPSATTAASAAGAGASCEALHEWSLAYVGTSPTLESLVPFDRAHRIAIFSAVTPDVRSKLWREQLRRLAQRPEWSARQRALIVEAIDLSTPAMYKPRDPIAREAAVKYWSRAQQVFPVGESRRPLYELGGPAPRSIQPVPSVWNRLMGSVSVSAQPAPLCDCSILWQDCFCYDTWCRFQYDGCGPYGWFECDGKCIFGGG
jgi:hypothetical protein